MMRIATSTIFSDQTLSIDNLESQYQLEGQELSTGISLNEPSDDPTIIAQDLSVRNDSAVTTQVGQNLTGLNNLLSTTDSTLSSLTSILQSARNLAIEGASDAITPAQRSEIGDQVNQLLEEAIGLANTQYDGKFIFSGTKAPAGTSLVTAVGNPPTSVQVANNIVQQSEELPNGQLVPTNVTLQQAFNLDASNGSPSIFDMLIRLRDTLEDGETTDESSSQINIADQSILPTTTIASLESSSPQILSTPLASIGNGNVAFTLYSSLTPTGQTFIFTVGQKMQNVIAEINAATDVTGVTASFNYQTQRLSLDDLANQSFYITDSPAAAGLATGNFSSAFLLGSTGDVVDNLSTQLGDIDNALSVALNAAGEIGATVQTVTSLSEIESSRETSDTQVQSNLEDTDIAKVTSQFTLSQTALEAAYETTTRLEQEDLFSYLQSG
ncbi:MAG TPA: flagellin hook IN motif-containing protein [Candidatus Acidoferrales bacterium]|nr:flagellin hook IN motif-containing protein [Candidatus Acidoferrales bacterium]